MKRPSFQFYPADWLSDFKARALTYEERGVYIDLLCYMWLEDDCSLPADTEYLEQLLKCGATTLQRVVQLFVNQGSKITHKRLLAERDKQDEWRRKSQKGGKISAKMRSKGGSRVVQPKGNTSTTTSTSSSKPSSSFHSEEGGADAPTPAQTMKDFILGVQNKTEETMELALKVAEYYKFEPEKVSAEFDNFVNYWCEKTKDGKRERWQLEKTFEVRRRLATWFMKAQQFKGRDSIGPMKSF